MTADLKGWHLLSPGAFNNMDNTIPNEAFQAIMDAFLQLPDEMKAQVVGQTKTQKPPAPPAGQDRAEFNGELSHMAQMIIMHLWGYTRLAHIYGCDCESVPRIHELVGGDMADECHDLMQSVAEMVATLPRKIHCHRSMVFHRSQVDVFIACHVDVLPRLCTADVLNSLLYMGPLGEFLAQELFQASVGQLMAADTDTVPNTARKKALNLIGDRIKEAFIPAGLLKVCEEKEQPRISNPLRARNKACTTYAVPVLSNQGKLPF